MYMQKVNKNAMQVFFYNPCENYVMSCHHDKRERMKKKNENNAEISR